MSQITKVRSSSRSGRRRCVAAVRLEHGRFDGSSEKSSPKTQRRKYREGYFESRYTSQKSPGLSVSNSMLGDSCCPALTSVVSSFTQPRVRLTCSALPTGDPAGPPPSRVPPDRGSTHDLSAMPQFLHASPRAPTTLSWSYHVDQRARPTSHAHAMHSLRAHNQTAHTHTHTRISPHTKPSTKVSRPKP